MKRDRSFAVGERVRVYNDTGMFEGTVVELLNHQPGVVVEHTDGIKSYRRQVFPQQCRKLRRKEKPPRVERWISGIASEDSIVCHKSPVGVGEPIHLVELKQGESLCPAGSVAVDREALERAWDKNGSNKCIYPLHENSEFFEMFCKALGIEKWE